MITIKRAKINDAQLLSQLGRSTYTESHGGFIADKNDLQIYLDETFSIKRMEAELADAEILYVIARNNDVPIGYAKLILNTSHEKMNSSMNCRLDKIYSKAEFFPLKAGQKLLFFLEDEARKLAYKSMWLVVYVKNKRAIRFYEKNGFITIDTCDFLVNGKPYENIVFSKTL
ncbi:MAG: GNAT family N-acetyltransferase [Flavobacteriales bacterium]|nr:GNAT family N-acetyltransferase [Flavobacteriales bacterium]